MKLSFTVLSNQLLYYSIDSKIVKQEFTKNLFRGHYQILLSFFCFCCIIRNRKKKEAGFMAAELYLTQQQKAQLDAGFYEAFGAQPERYFSAPGRTEIGGNHTDHQRGRVLAAAVNLDTLAAVRCSGTGEG